MRVVLREVPAGWREERRGDWTVLTAADDRVRIEASPIVAAAGFDARAVMERGVPADHAVEYVQHLDERTRDGWPMQLCTLRVMAGAVERELRLAAVYAFVGYAGVVVARARDRLAYDSARLGVLEVLAAARPDLHTDEPAAIAALWR